ncbi:MAG: ABC transporter substrate-binding protein, partial [Anaerolineae bacterium]|nr:ABC transporter substrate-binding protein [Anaerolineae bacterium]
MSDAAIRPSTDRATTDRRQVTVLFADLADFTALAEHTDPEDLRELQSAFFACASAPIRAHGGVVEKYIGDAVLAVFGVPQTHEDDAVRAARAALAMHAALTPLNERLSRERGFRLALRIGIHTGLVVATVEPNGDFVITGDTVNLAERFQEAAEPGAVLVGAETQALIADAFETCPLGPLRIRGRAEPVVTWRVLSARPNAACGSERARLRSPLVGRQAELNTLFAALGRLSQGQGGIVPIVGEAGLGKSRLVAEARNTLQKHGPGPHSLQPLTWLDGRCLSYASGIAYHLWIDMLRNALRVSADAPPAAAAQALQQWIEQLCPDQCHEVYPYLARLLAYPLPAEVSARLETLGPQQLQRDTFRAVETVVVRLAKRSPLPIVCEDLHWSDASSLELLEHLLPLVEQLPVLFVCVFRLDPEHGSWRLREMWARRYERWHNEIALQPLSPTETEALILNLLGAWPPILPQRRAEPDSLAESFLWHVLKLAEGNPFFVEEILRSLIGRGALTRDAATASWKALVDTADVAVPDTLQGVIAARIDALPEAPRRVLRLAAVIGRVFSYRLLAEVCDAATALDAHLLRLQRDDLIREGDSSPERDFVFKHELTREAAYDTLLKRERRQAHRQIAEALERLFPQRIEEQLGLLAYHWEHAEEAEKAIGYLLRAGDQARLLYAHQEAIGFYQRALALQQAVGDDGGAARTLMRLGLTYQTTFDYERGRQAYDAGFAAWQTALVAPHAHNQPPAPHALRTAYGSAVSLDPAYTGMFASFTSQLFSGLVEESPALVILPDVAESWKITDGGQTYVFRLRADARWSDGVPVTAGDFEFAWKRALAPETDGAEPSLMYDVLGARAYHEGRLSDPEQVGVCALDDRTLVVRLEAPASYFLHILALAIALPVPRHCVTAYGRDWIAADKIVSNGAFVLESFQPGQQIVLARSPTYHGSFSGNLQRVEVCLQPVSDWQSRIEMYRSGLLDVLDISGHPKELIETVSTSLAGDYITAPRPGTSGFGFNVCQPPFSDVKVRQAFAMALDRDLLWRSVFGRHWPRPQGGLVPPGMPGHSPDLGHPHDPDRARQLLAEAGYPNGRGFPAVQVLTFNTPIATSITQWFVDQLREQLGVTLTYRTMPFPDYWRIIIGQRSADLPCLWLPWGSGYPDPDSSLRWIHITCIQRHTGWQNADFERFIEEARHLTDHAARLRLYKQAD